MMCWSYRKPETEAGMALAEVRQRSVHMAHRIVVGQMEQMKVNFRAVELRSVVVQSLYPDSKKRTPALDDQFVHGVDRCGVPTPIGVYRVVEGSILDASSHAKNPARAMRV